MPRQAGRPADSDAEKLSEARQKPESSMAANGDSGGCVNRVPSFLRQKAPPKATPANREGMMGPHFIIESGNDSGLVHHQHFK